MSIDEIIKIYEEWIPELELLARYNDNNVCDYLRYNAVAETIKLLKEYRWIFRDIPKEHDLISKIEKAMGFKLFLWQKTFIATNVFRQYGETTAKILRRLTKSDEPIDLTRIVGAKERFEAQETIKIYERLKAAGVKTCPVFRTKKESAEYMRRNEEPYKGESENKS